MPRLKRQRPAWLPRWVPFKDGRLLGLAKQTVLAWISTILALIFLSLTIAYATEKSRFSTLKWVHSSRSNTILVLRVLSEAAGVFLAGSIHSTFEVVQWVLISRPEGIRFPQFLALQSSTGALGLIALAMGKGLPANQWPMKPRIMALVRLMAELTIPVLGVLVMSNVNIYTVYVQIPRTAQPFAFGMEPFNGSVAGQLGVMEDLLFNINYVSFLSNPLHAIDISPKSANVGNCVHGLGATMNDSCTRQILIAQEYQNINANLPFAQYKDSEVVLSNHQQIYSMEFHDNVAMPQNNAGCEVFESGPGQYRLCTSNADDGSLKAAIIPCPVDLVNQASCSENTTWYSNPGFSTALKLAFLNATVSYDRSVGTILSYQEETKASPTFVNATELLGAFKVVLNTTDPLIKDTSNILGPPSHFFGRLIAGHMYRTVKISETSPSFRARGVNAVQSLLGLTLFYCQNGILGQTVLPFSPNATGTTLAAQNGAFQAQPKTATVALADTRYRIRVGRATLIAYSVLSGTTLLICLTALLVGSILELVKFDAEPTLWPMLDFWTQCRVEDLNGKVIPAHKRVEMAWIYWGHELFKEIDGLRVTRRKRKMREETPEIELPNVGEG